MRQRLGQHFLKNEEVIADIIRQLDVQEGDTIIEIGPGAGALTLPLAAVCKEKNCTLIAIEKDEALASLLEWELKKINAQAEIIKADALVQLPREAEKIKSAYKLVGNIPYYITGSLLRLIGELEHKPSVAIMMVQKEVAERVASQPPKMNLLAAATQAWAEVNIIAQVGKANFDPPPEVDSAVIMLTSVNRTIEDIDRYYNCIHAVFKQPRKKLGNNISPEILKKAGISPDLRGQNLSIGELIKLSMVYF